MSALLNIEKEDVLETNFGEGGVIMPSTSIYSSGWCLFVGADLETIPFYARSYFHWGGAVTPFPRISVTAIAGVAASTSISFLLTFCRYQNSPHAKKPTETQQAKSPFLVKINLLASSFWLDRIFLLEKMCSHSKHVWNRWVFPS